MKLRWILIVLACARRDRPPSPEEVRQAGPVRRHPPGPQGRGRRHLLHRRPARPHLRGEQARVPRARRDNGSSATRSRTATTARSTRTRATTRSTSTRWSACAEPDVEYCYLDGPHYHYFEPPRAPDFKLAGDAYFYVGDAAAGVCRGAPAVRRDQRDLHAARLHAPGGRGRAAAAGSACAPTASGRLVVETPAAGRRRLAAGRAGVASGSTCTSRCRRSRSVSASAVGRRRRRRARPRPREHQATRSARRHVTH